jgi:hypothetical protein
MFQVVCAVRLSARDSIEEAQAEAQWNWDQYGLSSWIKRDGNLVAVHEDGVLKPLVNL